MVQTPWALLNQLADRNMEIWKGVQQGIKSGLSAAADKPEKGGAGDDDQVEARPAARARRRSLRH